MNFAEKFARTIKVPISHDLMKTRETAEQKIFQNSYSKQDNVKNAFYIDAKIVKDKTIPDFIIASPILKFKPIVRFNQIRNFFFLFG